MKNKIAYNYNSMKKILLLLLLPLLSLSAQIVPVAKAQAVDVLLLRGTVDEIRLEGINLIEKGVIYSTISTKNGSILSPATITEDIKSLFQLGYFQDISVDYEVLENENIALIFKFQEKPRIKEIKIVGIDLLTDKELREDLKTYPNNMINLNRIKQDVKTIQREYRKKGYLQTQVSYEIEELSKSAVLLTYKIVESPQVFLTDITVTGTKRFYPLDIQRLMQSSEIDCFAWMNSSGKFQEEMINQDLAILTQHYLRLGYIRVKIDKPKVKLIQNKDLSRVQVDLHITEGEQYFTGKVDIVADDQHEFLFNKEEMLASLALQSTDPYNPFKQNQDRYALQDTYLEQGYAKVRTYPDIKIDEENKTVDVTYHVIRGEKAYIGRVEIQGNFETKDSVVRQELEIHDNELYNGIKIRESQQNINRLGFFKPGTGVRFEKQENRDDNILDYNILLDEAQTGSFSGSLSYAGQTGFMLTLKVQKKNLFGSGKTASFSIERRDAGDTRFDLSLISPYWLETKATASISAFSSYSKPSNAGYDIRSNGFNVGLGYPIWRDWSLSGRYSWKIENYDNITTDGKEQLDGKTESSERSLSTGLTYSTVNHPMFPSEGYEATAQVEQYGDFLGGTTKYRNYRFDTRWFTSFNEEKTVVFMARFHQYMLEQTDSDAEIPYHRRFRIGGVTTVRGHDWSDIRGPISDGEVGKNFLKEKYPYQGDYSDCANTTTESGVACSSLSTEKSDDRKYLEQHSGGTLERIFNFELLFPLTREGQNIRGVTFLDIGNVWAEDKMYELTGKTKDFSYFRKSTGLGVRIITPMGVLRFEYGIKLDKKEGETPSRLDFHISGLF